MGEVSSNASSGNNYGGTAAGAFVGGLMGMASDAINYERQQKLLSLQAGVNDQLAENAYQRQRSMYNDFYSWQAQRKQIEEAGLNPALLYGMGGKAGQSTPNVASATTSGVGSPTNSLATTATAGAQLGAQVDNIKADTALKQADTEKRMQEIWNDPILKDYYADYITTTNDAYKTWQEQSTQIQNNFIKAFTDAGIRTDGWTWSKGKTNSGSDGYGYNTNWQLNVSTEKGENFGLNIDAGGGISFFGDIPTGANAKMGTGGNYGYKVGESVGMGEGHGENWQKSFLRAIQESQGGNHGYNLRNVDFDYLDNLIKSLATKTKDYEEQCERARQLREERTEKYLSNKRHSGR
ncbi:minor capsid protein [Capybara microvirus Cap1_SP_81]|nr:minor capsid protein [Capybara microvirus Cap1_SP_81]